MLWRVKNSGLSILGSVHVLDVPPLPMVHGQAEFGAATRVLFEHDLTQVPDMSFAQLKPGESLSARIPAALYTAVKDRCREWSLSLENFTQLQPWLVALALSVNTAARAGLSAAKTSRAAPISLSD